MQKDWGCISKKEPIAANPDSEKGEITMEKEIIIRAESDETMVAVIDDHRLVELYIDRAWMKSDLPEISIKEL